MRELCVSATSLLHLCSYISFNHSYIYSLICSTFLSHSRRVKNGKRAAVNAEGVIAPVQKGPTKADLIRCVHFLFYFVICTNNRLFLVSYSRLTHVMCISLSNTPSTHAHTWTQTHTHTHGHRHTHTRAHNTRTAHSHAHTQHTQNGDGRRSPS